jgi:uncharacterized membrane protein YgdD (TMEM256/DUF423 family)
MNWLSWIGIGSIFSAFSVIFGAFGAHALKKHLEPSDLEIFEIGVRYQTSHAIALLMVGLVLAKVDGMAIQAAGWCFVAGILVFSGSLYALVLTGHRWLGAVTPIGGLLLIAGWVALAVGAFWPKPNLM